MRKNIRFSGAGGQGVILASVILARAYGLGEGKNISQTQSYGPEARGGACKAELVVSDQEIDYMKVDEADIFVAFNQMGFDKYIDKTKEDCLVLINSTLVDSGNDSYYKVPATEIAENLKSPITVNIVMLGALTRLLGDLSPENVKKEMDKNFRNDLIDINEMAFDSGYEYMAGRLDRPEDTSVNAMNVLVCVTKQKTCDRLIARGREVVDENGGELSIIHVTRSKFTDLGDEDDLEALDYLYEEAIEKDTNLTLIRSENAVEVLINFIMNNDINYVILGKSPDASKENIIKDKLTEQIAGKAQIEVVP